MTRYLIFFLIGFLCLPVIAQEKITVDRKHYEALLGGLSESFKAYSNVLLREDKMDVELLSTYSSSFILYVSSLSVQHEKSRAVKNKMCENFEGFSEIQKSFASNMGLYSDDEIFIASRMLKTGQTVIAGEKINCVELAKDQVDWGSKVREKYN